jgi:hypothetical protein
MRTLWGLPLLVGLLGAVQAAALPVLSEVFYDAVGSDDGFVFVEIYGEAGTHLDGLTVEGINGSDGGVTVSLSLSGVIPDDGLYVLADEADGGVSSVPGPDQLLDFDFQNGPDSILLRDGDTVLDAVGYGVFDGGEVFAGEGSPAPDPPAGSSLARRFADIDSGDNAADFLALEVPTPGSAPLAGIPEPSSALLLTLGLLGLARMGRRAPTRIRPAAASSW